ncbi:hypothetical protein AUEXF2481DRAFT_700401 [Aureobasidium subglaciale EXF-2481]|uniref:HAT C-terminal dimerisation domain-containing protein n=1 Tax=Aureobasidium subglaciale (strain EXF-2481) TaxID=1043005 RepID=A0A074Y4K5_AURSE|nr:uncharacterized protein AUEXF2481DRAFT_700401 [Aureobasidium subglaciale EXF-2481]KEQ92620.1 hypothetical protein AUEXF2481DRAFT_700401 [Aureobasidium subglaciale EXF-2481]
MEHFQLELNTWSKHPISAESPHLFDLDDDVMESLDNEYQQWFQRPWAYFGPKSPPLELWTSNAIKKTSLQLQKVALDVFTVPATLEEPERVFSSTRLMMRPRRLRLLQKVIAMSQCLRD